MRTSAEIEAAAPSDEEVHEAMELLHTRFVDPPFLKRLGDLRVMMKTFDRCPDYSCLSRLLLPLEAEDLVQIAAAVSEEIPTPRWNASQRSTVIAALARVCAALFRAGAICAEAPRSNSGAAAVCAETMRSTSDAGAAAEAAPAVEVSSTPATKPAAVTSSFATPVAVSLPPPSRRFESACDITARHDAARHVQLLRARHWSRFPATHALCLTRGIFPETPVSVVDWDIELLLGFKDALEAETLAIDLLAKSCHASGPGSSLATNDTLSIIKDPDSVFEGMLRSGVVSLAGLHPFEMLVSLPPFAGWTAKACEHCFYGGVSNEVLALENYVANELSFLTPIGALYVHGPFSEVRRLLAKCDAASALFCSRDLLFNLAKCVEIAGEGHSGEWDTVVYKTLALCYPYRTSESAPRSALALLLQ